MESLSSIQALAIVTKEKIFGPVYDKAIVAVCEQFNAFTMETVFLDIDIETLIFILSSDRLNISSELDVFKAAHIINHERFHFRHFQILCHCHQIADKFRCDGQYTAVNIF
jgi:hypothetical protein